MAIHIPKANLTILEMPKTGTTWVRKALAHAEIIHKDLRPVVNACPRHSPAWCYDTRLGDSRVALIMRHPETWMESYWRIHTGKSIGWQPNRLYLHKVMFGEQIGEDFNRFIEDTASRVVPYYELFMERCAVWLRHKSLTDDLTELLRQSGVSEAKLDKLRAFPRANVTDDREPFIPRPEWSDNARLVMSEHCEMFCAKHAGKW